MRLPILIALLALAAASPAFAGDRGGGHGGGGHGGGHGGGGGCGGGCGGGGYNPPSPPSHGGGGGHHGGNTNINVNVNAAARASASAYAGAGARAYSTGTFEGRGVYGGTLIGAGGGFSYGDYGPSGYGYGGPIYAETRGPAPVSRPFGYRVWGFGRDYRTTDSCYRGCTPPPSCDCRSGHDHHSGGYGHQGGYSGGYQQGGGYGYDRGYQGGGYGYQGGYSSGAVRGGSSYSSYESSSEAIYVQPEAVYIQQDQGGYQGGYQGQPYSGQGPQSYIPDYAPARNDQGYYGDLPPPGAHIPYRQEPGERG